MNKLLKILFVCSQMQLISPFPGENISDSLTCGSNLPKQPEYFNASIGREIATIFTHEFVHANPVPVIRPFEEVKTEIEKELHNERWKAYIKAFTVSLKLTCTTFLLWKSFEFLFTKNERIMKKT